MGYTPERGPARDPVPRLQGPGRQEEGGLRRGPGRPDREAHPGRRRRTGSSSACTRRPGSSVLPTATVAIRRPDGEVVQDAAIGDGPVDAIFKAVERVTGVRANLTRVRASGASPPGKDAQGEVTLELEVESDDRIVPRPRGLDRHHRGLGRGLSQRRQRHRHPQGTRPRPRGHRPARGGGVRLRS